MAYLLTNTEKRELAEMVAYALVGATGVYPLVLVVQFVLLAAWAFAEAVMDVKALFRGEKVELWKSEATWRTSISGLVGRDSRSAELRAGLSEQGLSFSYNDYLKLFLLMRSTQNLCIGSLDMIQVELCAVEPWFQVKDCYGLAAVSVEFTSSYRLITLPLIGSAPGEGYRLTVNTEYQYP